MKNIELKCISLWQPCASAIALGLKKYETRAYPTRHVGVLGIHATLKRCSETRQIFYRLFQNDPDFSSIMSREGFSDFNDLPFGQLLCVVDVYDCVPTNSVRPNSLEKALGDYSANRYAWKLGGVRRLVKPIPTIGKQGFFFLRLNREQLQGTGLFE